MEKDYPLISVIVPVFNGQDYIEDLVGSVIKQSYTQWELILVNDGSTDSSGIICEKCKEQDSRISVIHQKNEGLSGARNAGIKAARGEFVAFVDVDDLLLDGYLKALSETILQSPEVDVATCGYAIITGNTTSLMTYESRCYIGKQEIAKLIGKTQMLSRCCVWGRLFRRNVLVNHNIFFDKQLLNAEDRPFLYQYLIHARGIATTSYVGYLYGSFSPTSNKNRYYPFNVLEYRQSKQTEATKALVQYFSLEGTDVYLPVYHLIIIMVSALQRVFSENGFSIRTIKQQKKFYDNYYDDIVYGQLKNCSKWNKLLQNDKIIKNVVSGNFWLLNWQFLCNALNLRMRLFAHHILKRDDKTIVSLNKTVSIINK